MDSLSDCSTEQSILIMDQKRIIYQSCREEMIQVITQSYEKFKGRLPTYEFSRLVSESLVYFYHEMIKKDIHDAAERYREECKLEDKESYRAQDHNTFQIEKPSGPSGSQRASNQSNQNEKSQTKQSHQFIQEKVKKTIENKEEYASEPQIVLNLPRTTQQALELIQNYAKTAQIAAQATEKRANAIQAFKREVESLTKIISQRNTESEIIFKKISFFLKDASECQMQVQKETQRAKENHRLLLQERRSITETFFSGRYRQWVNRQLLRAESTAEEAVQLAVDNQERASYIVSQVFKLAEHAETFVKRQNQKLQLQPSAYLVLSSSQVLPVPMLPDPQQKKPQPLQIHFNRAYGPTISKDAVSGVVNSNRLNETQTQNSKIRQDNRTNELVPHFKQQSSTNTKRT